MTKYQLIAIALLLTALDCLPIAMATTLSAGSTNTNNLSNASPLRLNLNLNDLDGSNNALLAAANKGDIEAQVKLGLAYQTGDGGSIDYHKAANWLKLAAIQGNSQAQELLGAMYFKGQGVFTNKTIGIALLMLSSESGRASAILALSEMSIGMSEQHMQNARKLAKECKLTKFRNCF